MAKRRSARDTTTRQLVEGVRVHHIEQRNASRRRNKSDKYVAGGQVVSVGRTANRSSGSRSGNRSVKIRWDDGSTHSYKASEVAVARPMKQTQVGARAGKSARISQSRRVFRRDVLGRFA